MKKSDVFNKKFPSPTDQFMYPQWKQFIALKQEVAKNWKEEVLSGMIGFRAYTDLRDVRLNTRLIDLEQDPVITVSLKPVIGHDTISDIAFYLHMFRVYNQLITDIYRSMMGYRLNTKLVHRGELGQKKMTIHITINILRVLVMLANAGKLTRDHLDIIEEANLEAINATVKSVGFAEHFSIKDEHTRFYEDSYQKLVAAFWKWSDKRIAAEEE